MAGRRLGVWRRFSVILVKPWMVLLTKPDWRGTQHVPATGGVIFVANHLSHFDPFVIAHFVYANGRWPRFLAKASLFRLPVLGRLMHAVQQIPVHRGTADAASALDAAIVAVRAGQAVIIYPEGTTTRDPQLWPMRGKTGIARLAMATGAPVVPLVTWGPQRVFDPRTRTLRLRPRTPMVVRAGEPIDCSALLRPDAAGSETAVTSADLVRLTDEIMAVLTRMLATIRESGKTDSPPVPTAPEGEARS